MSIFFELQSIGRKALTQLLPHGNKDLALNLAEDGAKYHWHYMKTRHARKTAKAVEEGRND